MFELQTTNDLLSRFQSINSAASPDEIFIRDTISLKTVHEARFAYEHFCHLNPEMTREFDNFLFLSRNRHRLLDIGCLFGVFSFCFSIMRSREAIAVDPSPEALSVLRKNCELNPEVNVRVYECAAGASESIVHMRTEWKHLVAATSQSHDTVPVRTRPCDGIISDLRFKPDIVKIDVEGYENEVLKGMQSTMDHLRPDIHIEVHPNYLVQLNSSALETKRLLKENGYNIFGMDGLEVKDVNVNHQGQLNWYAIHRFGSRSGKLLG